MITENIIIIIISNNWIIPYNTADLNPCTKYTWFVPVIES